jgi:hypothetical protein
MGLCMRDNLQLGVSMGMGYTIAVMGLSSVACGSSICSAVEVLKSGQTGHGMRGITTKGRSPERGNRPGLRDLAMRASLTATSYMGRGSTSGATDGHTVAPGQTDI